MSEDTINVTVAYYNKDKRPHPADRFNISIDDGLELIFFRREIPFLIGKLLEALCFTEKGL